MIDGRWWGGEKDFVDPGRERAAVRGQRAATGHMPHHGPSVFAISRARIAGTWRGGR